MVKEEAKLSQILHIASMCEQKKIQFESSVDEFITHSAEEVKARID